MFSNFRLATAVPDGARRMIGRRGCECVKVEIEIVINDPDVWRGRPESMGREGEGEGKRSSGNELGRWLCQNLIRMNFASRWPIMLVRMGELGALQTAKP